MRRKILIIIGCITILTFTGCAQNKQTQIKETEIESTTENIETFSKLEEINNLKLTDKKIQIADKIIELPMKVDKFTEKTNFNFSKYFGSNSNEDTILKPNETGTVYMTTNDNNILMVEVTNLDTQDRKLSRSYVTGVDVSITNDEEINKHQKGILYTLNGITYGDNIKNYEKLLKKIEKDNYLETTKDNNKILFYSKDKCNLTICYDSNTNIINEIKFSVK